MANRVEVILTADEARAVKAWQNFRNSIDAAAGAQDRFAKSSKRAASSAKDQDSAFAGIVSKIFAMGGAYLSVETIVSRLIGHVNDLQQANQDAASASEHAAKIQEFRQKRLQVTLGQGPLASKESKDKLAGIAQETATSNEETTDIALMLASSGATTEAATGGGTKKIAQFIKAQALKGEEVNVQQFTDSITRAILAQNKPLNEETIGKLVEQLQSPAVKESKFKVIDLDKWAAEMSALQTFAGMSQEDVMALAAATSGSLDAARASNQAREIFKNLSVAGSRPDRVKALAQIQMKPEDVDMVGETWDVALGRLKEGLNRVPEEQRQGILDKLVEGANIGEFNSLAGNIDQIQNIKSRLKQSDLAQDARTMETGRGAAETRLTNQEEDLDAKRGSYNELYRKAFKNELKSRNVSAFELEDRLKQFDQSVNLGVEPKVAAQTTHNRPMGITGGEFALSVKAHPTKLSEATEQRFVEAVGGPDEAEKLRQQARRKPPEASRVPGTTPVPLPPEASRVREQLIKSLNETPAAKDYKITGDESVQEIDKKGLQISRDQRQARREVDKERASELGRLEDLMVQLIQVTKQGQAQPESAPQQSSTPAPVVKVAAPSVTVTMPGHGTPAKPVAAAGIAASTPR